MQIIKLQLHQAPERLNNPEDVLNWNHMISCSWRRQVCCFCGSLSWEQANGLNLPRSAKPWFEPAHGYLHHTACLLHCWICSSSLHWDSTWQWFSGSLCVCVCVCETVWRLCSYMHSLYIELPVLLWCWIMVLSKKMSENVVPFVSERKPHEYKLAGWVCKDKGLSWHLTCWLTACLLLRRHNRTPTLVAPERLQSEPIIFQFAPFYWEHRHTKEEYVLRIISGVWHPICWAHTLGHFSHMDEINNGLTFSLL